jgi:hypothetical protein
VVIPNAHRLSHFRLFSHEQQPGALARSLAPCLRCPAFETSASPLSFDRLAHEQPTAKAPPHSQTQCCTCPSPTSGPRSAAAEESPELQSRLGQGYCDDSELLRLLLSLGLVGRVRTIEVGSSGWGVTTSRSGWALRSRRSGRRSGDRLCAGD